MSVVELVALPLTPEAFRPYGQVVAAPAPSAAAAGGAGASEANQGTASRTNWLATLENTRPAAAAPANVCLFRSGPRALGPAARPGDEGSFQVKLLERHPFSSQLFVPLNAPERYLVVVALPRPEAPGVDVRREGAAPPDTTTLRAFMASRHQGVNYAAGVWHHPLAALDGPTDFACVVHEDGTADDCHIVPMEGVTVRVVVDGGGGGGGGRQVSKL